MTNFARNLKSHHTMNLKSHHTMRYFTHQSNRIFAAVFVLLTMLCSKAWGAIELFSADFTSWETQSVTAGSTVDGIYFKSATDVTNGTGIAFKGNATNSSNFIAIPLTGINGSITITVTYPSARPQWKNYLKVMAAEPTASDVSSNPPSIGDNTRPGSNTTTSSWTLNCNKSYGVFYIGVGSNNSAKTLQSITITTPCTAPTSVDVTGTWHIFPGEPMTLTATATGGYGEYSYQWYKGGTSEGNKIDGATSATYTKDNCTYDDAGHYYCKVSAGGECDTWSGAFDVKMLRLYINVGRGGTDYGYVDLLNTHPDENKATGMIFLGQEWDYAFSISDGCGHYYGQNNDPTYGAMHSGNCTGWAMNSDQQCCMRTQNGAHYTFIIDYTNMGVPVVSVIYPPDDQDDNFKIYFDNNEVNWTNLHYRVGTTSWTVKYEMTLVPGTANLYEHTTHAYTDLHAWHICNNSGWSDAHSIYKTKTGDSYAITQSINFEGGATTQSVVSITPGTSHSTGGDEYNNNCEFYSYKMTPGMKTQNVSIEAPVNGTITVSYIDPTNAPQSFTSGNRDLAHTCILTITTTPDCGYQNATLTVNGDPFTSGNTYILYAKAVITATFEPETASITYHTDGGTINDAGYATEYTFGVGATLPTDVTKAGGWRFMGWYDNSSLSGSPVTEITTTECGNKEYWAKWMTIPIFTWTYDATVQAGGIYDMSVSSTGDAAVTITILEVISGVSSSFTSGNPATGHVTIGAYPSATTFTYQATSPATASYGELTETRTVTINRCETEHQLAYGVGYTDGGSSSHPRYFHETEGVGWLTKSTGTSGCGGSDASWSGESWITKSNKDGVHLLQTYKGNIVKIVYYVMAGGANATISALRMSDSYISGESQGENALTDATIVYNNNPSNTGLTKDAKEVVSIQFAEPLAANTYLYLKFSTSSTLYGAKLYEAAGNLPTSVAFSGPASIEKTYGDANFTQAATQTTAGTQSGGAITYSSSDKTVATVNAATGEVTMLNTGRTVITATLAAYGCFTKATASYELIVKPCDDPE